jgi:putative hydrolase of the HAD superfamily
MLSGMARQHCMRVRCATVTWLICDYGEVLSIPQPDEDLAAIASAAGADGTPVFWESYWRHRPAYDRADVTAGQYWQEILSRAASPEILERIVAADVRSWLHPNLDSIGAATALMDRGVRLALFSNAPLELARELETAPWLEPFSRKFFSCRLRAVKPDPGAYRAVLSELGARPDEVVFVDDRPANVAGAEAVGIRAILFDGPDRLAELL